MFGKKSEKKKKHMGAKLAVGAVAAAGAVGFVKGSKRWLCEKYRRLSAKLKAKGEQTEAEG